ncbi:hypothetical protein NXX39_29195 [Bacteroides ovatus]|uniref:hypothetical protein n=1 Tax=Bacteroides ovatus TaxID=28116 RepID=UPI002165343B|nr:hypothetical protein [Bacteroides ovatus]MCS2477078.1 hypothetical protein [Bacteroides ovatus]
MVIHPAARAAASPVHSISQLFSHFAVHSSVRSSVQASGHTFSPASGCPLQSSGCPLVRLFSRF